MSIAARNRAVRPYSSYAARTLTRRGLLGGLTGAGALAATALIEADRAFAASREQLKFDGFQNVLDLEGPDDVDRVDPDFQWHEVINVWTAANAGNPQATLYFPPREFKVGGKLLVYTNERLVGHGPLSILKATADHTSIMLSTVNSDPSGPVTDVRIEDLTLNGNGVQRLANPDVQAVLAGGQSLQLLNIQGARIHVRRVNCIDSPHVGMTGGIGDTGLTESSICDCRVTRCPKDGITVWALEPNPDRAVFNVILARNLIKDSRDDHLGVLLGAKRIAIIGNVIDYGPDEDNTSYQQNAQGSCIMVRQGATNMAIVGNVCRGGARSGIELRPSSTLPVEDITIANNVIVESGNVRTVPTPPLGAGTGIFLNTAGGSISRIAVTGNVISAPRNHGVWLRCAPNGTIRDVVVSNNVIRYDRMADYDLPLLDGNGILCADESTTSTVENIRIDANVIVDTRRPGVEVKGRVTSGAERTVSRVDVQGNQIVNPGPLGPTEQPAVRLEGVEGPSASGNRAHYPSSPAVSGLQLQNVSKDVLIEGNTVATGGAIPPVDISAFSDIKRLRIRDNPGFNPWTGERTIDGTGSDRNLRVPGPTGSLPVPFPTVGGVPKVKIIATPQGDLEAYVSVHSVQADNFTLRVILPGAVPPGSKISWIAEPFDD